MSKGKGICNSVSPLLSDLLEPSKNMFVAVVILIEKGEYLNKKLPIVLVTEYWKFIFKIFFISKAT